MIGWFKKKSKLEKLRERYRDLMKKSYETSLRDPQESDRVHRQADKLFEQIKYFSMEQSDQ